MPDRYWVGGTANWDGTAGTKWATTSGGAGGASVPTSSDDVFFNAASGAVTVTVSATANCLNLNFTGFTGTLAGSSAIQFFGSLTLVSGMTWTHTGAINTMASSSSWTITTAGKTLGSLNIGTNGGTATWTLQDALSLTGALTVTQGTFTTNNFNVTAASLSSSNSNTRTINLGSSTVTLSSSTPLSFFTNTNLTFNAGTSTLIFNSTTVTVVGGQPFLAGVTFYNVQFTNTNANTTNIQGINVFNNLDVVAPVSAGVRQVTFDSRQTINGTLSTTGTAGNRRVWFRGLTYGIAQTLTINSAASLTDADFRDIYVIGTAAPISGTRIGDLRGCRGITFSTPKTVYWNLAGGGNWSDNAWAATSGGGVSTNNFPLAQDTAVIENTGLNTSATVTVDAAIGASGLALPSVDMSARTNAMTLATGTVNPAIFGDWKNGSGTTLSGTGTFTFFGRNTQTITSAGRAFTQSVVVDTYGGTVELVDALNIGTGSITVTNGTFDTKNYNVTAGSFVSSNSNVRTITLGSSTITLSSASGTTFQNANNLTFNAGTSSIVFTTASGGTILNGGGLTFYDVSFTSTSTATSATIAGTNTYRNLTFTAPASAGLPQYLFNANQTVTGTLTCAGATAVRRIFLRSDTLGTQRDLTVGTLVATDCDFRDIDILGAAAGSSPTRAGDCGGNAGITFPAPKTVYWNLAGTQNWSATAWASSSGGTPDINQFPLAQDTAVFDNTGSAGTITTNAAWNIGTLNMSGRTSACTIDWSNSGPFYYGNVLLGSGVTPGTTGAPTFAGRGTQTITSNGNTWSGALTIDCFTGTVQLADALTLNSARSLVFTSGTFDAVTYNVTAGNIVCGSSTNTTLRMGSGTWTASGAGTGTWNFSTAPASFFKGTANIVLSDTSTSPRSFQGGGLSYNKLTIGGTTGTSTLTITGNNQFTELASTKTVAHTIALGSTSQVFGAWTVSGTAGNVVSVSGTATLAILGSRVSGVDYLSFGPITISAANSLGEFYAGANSTSSGTGIILTAAPAPVTRYWRGGTGTWDATTTTNWSATSGGAGGASVPTSADAVIFNSASNATAYTVTCTATQLRCGSLTMAGPASGNVTWAGTAPITAHGNVTLAATGITRTYTGILTLSGSGSATITTNGISLGQDIVLNGVNSNWSLGSAITLGTSNNFTLVNGTLNTANYTCSFGRFLVQITSALTLGTVTLNLGSSTITENSIGFTINGANRNFTLNAGTSTFNNTVTGTATIQNPLPDVLTFYNYNFTGADPTAINITGPAAFNNLSFAGRTTAGVTPINISANQTINGTLTLSAGTNATMRTFLRSDTLGTPRTLTCAAFSATDVDFRDITIAGAAAPVSGTRLGDCKGNSGITFSAAKTVYCAALTSASWATTGNGIWAASSGGTLSQVNFPLAQDTAVFDNATLAVASTITINAAYNIGTIDMSARTGSTMTLATGTTTPTIYGNWVNGTGTTLTGTGTLTFAGRGTQLIVSAGRTFTQPITINSPSGSVTLQDAISLSTGFTFTQGTFDAAGYNVTQASSGLTGALAKTVAFGSGLWTVTAGGTAWGFGTPTNLTVTGTGTISLTSASAKTFAGGGVSYAGVTLDQGGAGTLTITGNNTFANITNTYKATGATTIAMGTTTQRVGNFTASGEAGRVLTVTGTSASSPATLIYTGTGQAAQPAIDYLAITGVRAYSLDTTWYAGANSTNNGSLGWYFEAGGGGPITAFIIESATAADGQSSIATLNIGVSETLTAADAQAAGLVYLGTLSESATVADAVEAFRAYLALVAEFAAAQDSSAVAASTFSASSAETATSLDATQAAQTAFSSLSESATASETQAAQFTAVTAVAETSTAQDTAAAAQLFVTNVAETAIPADSTSVAPSTFSAIALAAAQAAESFSPAGSVYNAALPVESAGITDFLVGGYLWNPIDDNQTPNWQNITNSQGSGWTQINTDDAPNWQPTIQP